MFARRTGIVVPTIQKPCPQFQTRIEGNHRLCLKLTISALIPLMIGVFTIVTTLLQQKSSFQQREQDKHDARLLREQSDRLADNLQKETALVNYLNDISNLLMSHNHTKILIHIRTKTLTSLRQLDADRKRYLLLYLYESELLYYDADQRNSSGLKISGADFNGIQFIGTKYNKCSFIRMQLFDVYLSNTSFTDCYIDRSNFSYSRMSNARFFKGILIRITFKFSLLDNTCFCHMKLSMTSFAGATLVRANFTGTIWEKMYVDFTNANLTDAILSNTQLANSTLENSILPNKTWGPIQKKNQVIYGDLDQQNCTFNGGRFLSQWIVFYGDFRVFSNENSSHAKCYFRAISFNTWRNFTYLIQTIKLENFTLLISSNNAQYHASASFQCSGGHYATMTVRHIDENNLSDAGVSNETQGTHLQSLTFSNVLRPDIRHVRILITIFRPTNETYINRPGEDHHCACYNVKYVIMNRK